MDFIKVDVKMKSLWYLFLVTASLASSAQALYEKYDVENPYELYRSEIVNLDLEQDYVRVRRDTPPVVTQDAAATSPAETTNNTTVNNSSVTVAVPVPVVTVTRTPLLGENGTGILKVNITDNLPKVSDPIDPYDNLTDFFAETPEKIKAEHNITNLTYDNHVFYNSTFVGNETYFNEYWANISAVNAQVHSVLSNSHRRATTVQLSFDFPFYGHPIRNLTVATGGFLYTGEHVHNWLAATQYIAPLMANFDTSLTNDSLVKLNDDGEKFTAFWENVTLQDDATKKFTFAVTLFKNGEIVFAYKLMSQDLDEINDADHPVKVGISDAYFSDNIVFYVRHKTIYEYHRVSFKNHMLSNHTLLRLIPLPTCLQYNTCDTCLNHETAFNCTWCDQIKKCSSGTDRNKQDWKIRRCEENAVKSASECPVTDGRKEVPIDPSSNGDLYTTDNQTTRDSPTVVLTNATKIAVPTPTEVPSVNQTQVAAAMAPEAGDSKLGGAVGAFLAVALACGLVGWLLYAFKNPHSRSGQFLIKYRPSQWNWRRGEARYTAATIHM